MVLPEPNPSSTALVTGASSGIGEAIARELAQRGHGVTLVAREAVVDLTSRFLPAMCGRGRGAVIVTSSTSAFQPLPGNATYAASKAFALSFAEALHREAGPKGVTVTALCPGPVKTGFQDASGAHDFAATLPKPLWRSPEKVAAAAVRGAERGRRVVVPGAPNRMLAAVGRFSPRPVVLRVMDST